MTKTITSVVVVVTLWYSASAQNTTESGSTAVAQDTTESGSSAVAQGTTASIPTGAAVPPAYVSPVYVWISVVCCTLLGLLFGLMAGPGKLLPFHPLYKMMKPGFDNLMGPAFGVPGDALRILIGFSELVAGWGFLVGVYGSTFSLLEGDLKDLADALLICDAIGALTIGVGVALYHMHAEGKPGAAPLILGLALIILYCRLNVTPLPSLTPEHAQFVPIFGAVCGVALIVGVAMRFTKGIPTGDLKKLQESLSAQPAE